MNNKIIVGIIIGIITVMVVSIAAIAFIFLKKDNNMEIDKNAIDTAQYYGKRGNITDLYRIKFLSKNDEYLVGMMGLPVSNEIKNFSNDDMIKFALNVALQRYSTVLEQKKNKDGSFSYVIKRETVDKITKEFFGIDRVEFDETANSNYSRTNGTFLFNENIEKVFYYYPVSQQNNEDGIVELIVDAIFVSDLNLDNLEQAKYEGKYTQDKVDNTVKFLFNESGKLVSYQYL